MGCPAPEQIAAAISGELAVAARGDVLDHTAACATCHAMLVALESESEFAIGSTVDDTHVPATGVLPAVGARIGRYELLALLGSGGMGVVYRARDTELARDVALKVLRPGRPADRLKREAQLLARLDAPNILTVHDVGEHAGAGYVVMELVEGKSLRGYLAEPHPPEEILAICQHAGAGLAAAHRAGVVHRDFKPDNVLVADDGSVHVADFGLAGASRGEVHRIEDSELTATGTVLGTPAYMAPEQIDGDATAASDQYAFCVTVWEALTGKRPIDAPTVEELFTAIRVGTIGAPARPLRSHVERALRRGLARDPAARYPDMPALLDALAPPRRRGLWIAGGIAALGIAGLVTSFAIRRDEPTCALAAYSPPAATLAAIARAFGPTVRADAEAALASWETARVAACKAPDPARFGCLQLVAARSRATLSALARFEKLEPDLVELGVARGMARCLALPPALTPALAAFDVEAARVDMLMQLSPEAGDAALPQLERFAQAVGEPAIARAQWLAARSAADRSDHAAAFAILPKVIASADKLGDDELRARASALHAEVLGRAGRAAEARIHLEQARASWARAGRPDELALGRAEVAILVAEDQTRRAAVLAEDLVKIVRARYLLDPPRITSALTRASSLWSAIGEFDVSVRLQNEQFAALVDTPVGITPEERASIETNTTELLTRGDHRGALRVAKRNLEILRKVGPATGALPVDAASMVGYLLSSIAQTHELLAESPEALVWYRNLRAFADDKRLTSLVATRLRASALEGEARHLNRLGRFAEAIEPARAVLALAKASADAEVKDAIVPSTIVLARALAETGVFREARALIEATYPTLVAKGPPYTRGTAAAYLAYALWETGDDRDRGRARALAGDAARDFEAARKVLESLPSLRPLLPVLERDVAALERWRATH